MAARYDALTFAASSTPAGTRWVIRSSRNCSSPAGGFFSSSITSAVCSAVSGKGGMPRAARSAACWRYASSIGKTPGVLKGLLAKNRNASSGRNDQLESLEILSIESVVAGYKPVALQQRMRADEEIRHRAHLCPAPLAIAALHLAGAQCGLRFDRAEANAHFLEHGQRLGAVVQRAADFGERDVADHHRAVAQALAQAGFGSVGLRAVGEQVDQDRRIDGDG